METLFFLKAHFRKKTFLVLTTILIIFTFALSAGVLMMSPMLFDAPGSEDILFSYMLIFAAALYPIIGMYGIIRGRKTFKRTKQLWPSLKWMLIIVPFAILVAIILGIALGQNNGSAIS